MSTLFIADLHLHPSRPAGVVCLSDLLQRYRGKADALYILGDLFESWVGDDDPEPLYRQARSALSACSRAGTAVFVMHGNRDFLIGDAFARETGCTLIGDPALIDLYGTPALLMHGDSLCIDDSEYQLVRTRVRDPEWQRQALSLPLEERLALAQQARELSVLNARGKDDAIMDVNPGEVVRVMEQHAVSLLIHGHTHRPGIFDVAGAGHGATRIVLGDWYDQATVLVADRRGRRLETLPCA